ncbi:chromate efflux transporter [Paenibacillus kobensis]|uniref:chromate efflux transporter n=1 Tax=Paenibacillus kobensis TaxID=59841 RepID=UPI000FDB7DB2|nr:chromate efflux transporter [Paenibacillus kobensis]
MQGAPFETSNPQSPVHPSSAAPAPISNRVHAWTVFTAALRLGLTSFGGPVAHIGYFRVYYVVRRQWLSDSEFADYTALCQFLPGPSSSQLGMAIGLRKAGLLGALAAWLGFTLPSALLMLLFAFGVGASESSLSGVLHGLELAAVAVVAQAIFSMGRSLAPDRNRFTMAAATAACALLFPGIGGQLAPLAVCAVIGVVWFRTSSSGTKQDTAYEEPPGLMRRFGMRIAAASLVLFAALLVLLPWWTSQTNSPAVSIADTSYRAGALVFGGGHVVLPMLEQGTVHDGPNGLTADQFMAGYAAAQAVPGPLFTFAAYIGASMASGLKAVGLAAVALAAIFLPSLLLITGAFPLWNRLRNHSAARGALTAVNAAVVGLLLAAFYDPVWKTAVREPLDFVVALGAFAALQWWNRPAWQVVAVAAAVGALLW